MEREYNLNLIITAPSVVYKVHGADGSVVMVDNPAQLPPAEKRAFIEEPYVRVSAPLALFKGGVAFQDKTQQQYFGKGQFLVAEGIMSLLMISLQRCVASDIHSKLVRLHALQYHPLSGKTIVL